jgi:NAD(P)-dependent dehydrogenase (short-subunit alcohol dehydrogenase family)
LNASGKKWHWQPAKSPGVLAINYSKILFIMSRSEKKTALVTGGAKGYGAGIAAALIAADYYVYITGRDEPSLEQAWRQSGAHPIKADATVPKDWDRVFEKILSHSGRMDVLVNNAGGGVRIAPIDGQSDNDIERGITLNLTSVIYGCRRAAPVMKKQNSGIIINISSVCSRHAWAGWGVYGAAKAGLENFSKSLYLELRQYGVRVTTLIPSWGATGFTDAAGLDSRDAATFNKCIHPAEIGKMVAEICALPSHLYVQETILWPIIQEVSPL